MASNPLRTLGSLRPALAESYASGGRVGRYFRNAWPRRYIVGFYVALAAFAALFGFSFGLNDGDNLVAFFIPLAILMAVAFWVLPDIRYPPVRTLRYLFVAMLFFYLCWPDYVALSVTGLPWITPLRATCIPMGIVLLICSFGSKRFRKQIADIINADRFIVLCAVVYFAATAFSILFSSDMNISVSRYFVMLYGSLIPFFASLYLFNTPNRIKIFGVYIYVIAMFHIYLVLTYELPHVQLPWAGEIPAIFQIDDPKIKALLAGSMRAGKYRVQSKFSTPIGLGEYLGFAVPFMLHFLLTVRNKFIKLLMFVSIVAALDVAYETGSRLAFICFLSSVGLYIFYQTVVLWRNSPGNIFAPAIMMAYPVFLALFMALVMVWRPLNEMVFGGGDQQASTDARHQQWAKGWPRIFAQPWGYGLGSGAKIAGVQVPGTSDLTIDSYYLSVLVESGVLGFIAYYGMFSWATARATYFAARSNDREMMYLGAVAVALANFLVSKYVYSQTENHPLAFVLLGIVVAMTRRYKAQTGALPPPPEEEILYRPETTDYAKDWQRHGLPE